MNKNFLKIFVFAFFIALIVHDNSSAFDETNIVPNKVILATSLKNEKKPWYAGKNWDIKQKLEKIFRQELQNQPLIIEVKHDVDQFQLSQILKSADTLALFWVSRSGKNNEAITGPSESTVIDYHGNSILNLFPLIHPKTRFLSLIGCNALQALNEQKSKGLYAHAPQIVVHAEKKTDARQGLKKALKDFVKRFKTKTWDFDENIQCPVQKGFEISVSRTALEGEVLPNLKIENKNTALGTLDSLKGPASQQAIFFLSDQIPTKDSDLKIIFTSEEAIEGKMGKMNVVSSHFDGKWDLFARPDGTPVGITMNVFRYDGSLTPIKESSTYSPFSCK